MISNYKYLARLWLLGVILFFPAALFAQPSVMQRGNLSIARESVVLDVVAADGNLVILGRVEGSVFLVNGDLRIEPGGVVKGNLTVLGGDLWVANGGAVEGEINVLSGKSHLDPGARVGPQVRVLESVPSLTPEKLALISRYIIFNRTAPADSFRLSALGNLDPKKLQAVKVHEQRAVRLDLFELGGLPLNLDEIADSEEVVFRAHELRARVVAVRFRTPAAIASLWDRLRTVFEEKIYYSVHNSLGDGAHWFFRFRSASYCLWYRDQTLTAVMVRHDSPKPGKDEWLRVEDLRDRLILEIGDLFQRGGSSAN